MAVAFWGEEKNIIMILYYSGYGGLKNHPEYDPEGHFQRCNLMLTFSILKGMRRILSMRLLRILKQRRQKDLL